MMPLLLAHVHPLQATHSSYFIKMINCKAGVTIYVFLLPWLMLRTGRECSAIVRVFIYSKKQTVMRLFCFTVDTV